MYKISILQGSFLGKGRRLLVCSVRGISQRVMRICAKLYAQRLDLGFIWPSAVDGVVALTAAQLGYLLQAIEIRAPDATGIIDAPERPAHEPRHSHRRSRQQSRDDATRRTCYRSRQSDDRVLIAHLRLSTSH